MLRVPRVTGVPRRVETPRRVRLRSTDSPRLRRGLPLGSTSARLARRSSRPSPAIPSPEAPVDARLDHTVGGPSVSDRTPAGRRQMGRRVFAIGPRFRKLAMPISAAARRRVRSQIRRAATTRKRSAASVDPALSSLRETLVRVARELRVVVEFFRVQETSEKRRYSEGTGPGIPSARHPGRWHLGAVRRDGP